MVYIHSWQAYQEAAESLCTKSPDKIRFCVKFRGSEGKLVLKITDDTTCIKYKTYSSIFLNRFEALNLSLMRKMQNRQEVPRAVSPPPPSGPVAVATPKEGLSRAGTPLPGGTSGVGLGSGGVTEGGAKKKKAKKRK